MTPPHADMRAGLVNLPHSQKDEAPGVMAGGFEVEAKEDSQDCAASGAGCKAFSTLRARLAIRGFALQQLPNGGYFVRSWGVGRALADLPAVAAFAEKVGA